MTDGLPLTVAVHVPCIPRDIPKPDRLFRSIAAQSLLPVEVVLALSETEEADAALVQARYAGLYGNRCAISVTVTSTTASAHPGVNRNATLPLSSAGHHQLLRRGRHYAAEPVAVCPRRLREARGQVRRAQLLDAARVE